MFSWLDVWLFGCLVGCLDGCLDVWMFGWLIQWCLPFLWQGLHHRALFIRNQRFMSVAVCVPNVINDFHSLNHKRKTESLPQKKRNKIEMYRFTKHRRICIFWHASLIVHLQLVYLHAFAILIYGYTINYKHVCLCIHSQLLSCCHFTEFCHLWGSSLTSWWSFGLPSGWGPQSYLIILRHLFYKLSHLVLSDYLVFSKFSYEFLDLSFYKFE